MKSIIHFAKRFFSVFSGKRSSSLFVLFFTWNINFCDILSAPFFPRTLGWKIPSDKSTIGEISRQTWLSEDQQSFFFHELSGSVKAVYFLPLRETRSIRVRCHWKYTPIRIWHVIIKKIATREKHNLSLISIERLAFHESLIKTIQFSMKEPLIA